MAGDFNIPFSIRGGVDKSSTTKGDLKKTVKQLNLIDVYKTPDSMTAKYTFFKGTHRMFFLQDSPYANA